ncbi:hypothetical protein PsorP6_000106 [Peronosclerospora sorghi]|uniref:Uncharacterized protein n=1 Tax=Peronosclerospora sorghi TaxID=230839 RepID=A0ACC0WY95_9STRA|nr:hypothetical protein PsorP6_000106 [Peronosclerospora sorghi]
MNFLKTLGNLVGPSATGGLPYTVDTPPLHGDVGEGGGAGGVVFEGLPDFVLYSGKSKHDPSNAVSIFKSRQPAGELTQNALRRIKTLRHPNILAYVDSKEVPNKGPVIIVTEHVMPLSEFLAALRTEYGAQSEEFTTCVSWGMRCILLALQFVNIDCRLIHGRLTPESIFVTKGGDWKLGGFELTAEITSDGPSYIYTAFQQYADVNYKSPGLCLLTVILCVIECQRSDWKAVATGPPHGMDMWAFACLMFYIFNDSHFRSSDISTAANIPQALRTYFLKAMDENCTRRPSPQKMLSCRYFNTPSIKRLEFLENLAVKDSDERAAFYKELCANVESLPHCFGVHKVLPAFKQIVEFGASSGVNDGSVKLDPSASHMLPAMVQVGSSLSAEDFKAQVLPIIVKLFSCNDRAVRAQLLQMMEKFAVYCDSKLVNSSVVFDNLCSGFTDAAPVLRELTVKSMLHVADKLSENNLNRVIKYFAKLQADPEPAIRTNTTICLGKIASQLNDATRSKVLFPAFSRALKDSFPHARLAGLRSLSACQEYFTSQSMANSIIPAISPLLLDVSITVRNEATNLLESFMKKVMDEAAQMKIREEREAKELELKIVSENGDHIGDAVIKTKAPNGSHNTSAYASFLTAWASPTVCSNENKVVESDGMSSALPSSRASAAIATSTLLSGSRIQNSSSTDSSAKHDNLYDYPVETAGGDDDSDCFDSPTDPDVSPDASPLSKSLPSKTSSRKQDVLRKPKTNVNSTSLRANITTLRVGTNAAVDKGWGESWGEDADVLASKVSRLNMGSSASALSTTTTAVPSSSCGLSSGHETASERHAKALEKSKAKPASLGAIKLDSTAKTRTDEWSWDF